MSAGIRFVHRLTNGMLTPRRLMIVALILLVVVDLCTPCVLNDCPYRRVMRSETCGSCGKEGEGMCVASGVCCTTEGCKEDAQCENKHCPLPYCEIDGGRGLCVTSSLCCSDKFCQRNLGCLAAAAKKLKLR
ncbi:hypothetical protein M3Y99_00502400 [Aphelenchoides fujianensis]|nr:hypothetical protein M3Y99_00502400 [Aphelenchoides fujianensis]